MPAYLSTYLGIPTTFLGYGHVTIYAKSFSGVEMSRSWQERSPVVSAFSPASAVTKYPGGESNLDLAAKRAILPYYSGPLRHSDCHHGVPGGPKIRAAIDS